MRLQYFPEPSCIKIEDRLKNVVTLNMEEAEDLYFGLEFLLRDMRKVIEDAQEARE